VISLEWYLILLIIFGSLLLLMATGLPVAFCFITINIIGTVIFFGFEGLENIILSIYSNLNTFILLPIPLFILMGEVMFHSGIGPVLIRVLEKWFGRLPGRLSLLAVAAGTLFSTLTGTSLASVAILGAVLMPEMQERNYKIPMSAGPILGSSGLAMMIPPSALAVLAGAIAEISIGKTLLGIIIPGFMLAIVYALYIIIRCWLQPSLAPIYATKPVPFSEKVMDTIKYVVPQGIIVFLVVGVIFLGVATPSEAAATGAMGTILLALCYKRLNWQVIKKSSKGTISLAGMLFLILCGSAAFSQIMAYSGASAGLTEVATGLPVARIYVVIAMQLVILFLGGFMDVVSIMLITLPIFIPVVEALDYSPVWFLVLFLLNIEMAGTSPPFGLSLFVMKGVVSEDVKMADIYSAALPFLGLDLIVMVMIMIFPSLALWLPYLAR
jgi:tripartite ATP-independent transporter DctM subunit